MYKSEFRIGKLDCPSEENLIRMKLMDVSSIKSLLFDIDSRTLFVYHEGEIKLISKLISELNLDSSLVETKETDDIIQDSERTASKALWTVLSINFLFFAIEITFGLISNSMGLVADSLDMLADSIVYGLSLIAIGGTIFLKKRIASIAGYFQIILALVGFFEAMRRFIFSQVIPDHKLMIMISIFALVANVICLYILQKTKNEEAHMKASMIFTSNDIIINSGVIVAGVLVMLLNTNLPDLIIGLIVFQLVLQGAYRILKLGK